MKNAQRQPVSAPPPASCPAHALAHLALPACPSYKYGLCLQAVAPPDALPGSGGHLLGGGVCAPGFRYPPGECMMWCVGVQAQGFATTLPTAPAPLNSALLSCPRAGLYSPGPPLVPTPGRPNDHTRTGVHPRHSSGVHARQQPPRLWWDRLVRVRCWDTCQCLPWRCVGVVKLRTPTPKSRAPAHLHLSHAYVHTHPLDLNHPCRSTQKPP